MDLIRTRWNRVDGGVVDAAEGGQGGVVLTILLTMGKAGARCSGDDEPALVKFLAAARTKRRGQNGSLLFS